MLSAQLQETFDFIKQFFEKNGRPPRLKELQAKFDITNKAILDRLKNLEKEGFIEMPDGVLSLRLKGYENDLFISYANQDKAVAQRIFDHFSDEGFRVWKDNMSLDYGDSFVPKIFDNIKRSRTFITLLSDAALKSKFVREEVACAKKAYIDNDMPNILPVKIKSDFTNKDIFSEISSLYYFTLQEGFEDEELLHLADKIHMLAYEHKSSASKANTGKKGVGQFIKKVHKDVDDEVITTPPPIQDYPYKEVILIPIGDRKEYKNFELEYIMRESLVRIQGWGGDQFPPYYYDYNQNADFMSGWIRASDMREWPEREWGLAYWAMDKNLNFFTRSVLREAFSVREAVKDKFAVDWLVFDVARSLIFLKNLMKTTGVKKWEFTLKYHGIKGRALVVLSSRRHGLFAPYQTKENELVFKMEVDENKDMKRIAYDICFEALTIFNWKTPNEQMLQKDLDTLFDAERFPD